MSKGFPNEPQKLSKIDKSVFWRSLKKGAQKGPSPRAGKVRSGSYLLHFSKVGGFKKNMFWVSFWDHLGDKIMEMGVQISSKKSSGNRDPDLVIWGSIFGTIFG